MAKMEEAESEAAQMQKSTMKLGDFEGGMIKVTDKELEPLWEDLSACYNLCFNLQGQNITDQVQFFRPFRLC